MATEKRKISDLSEIGNIGGNEVTLLTFLGKSYRARLSVVKEFMRYGMSSTIKIVDILPSLPVRDIVAGEPYAIGPVTDDQGNPLYKLYVYNARNESWNYMGYMNSSTVGLTDELGDSKSLAMSQYGVTKAVKPIVMTESEFNDMLASGEITDDDMTIRYIVEG